MIYRNCWALAAICAGVLASGSAFGFVVVGQTVTAKAYATTNVLTATDELGFHHVAASGDSPTAGFSCTTDVSTNLMPGSFSGTGGGKVNPYYIEGVGTGWTDQVSFLFDTTQQEPLRLSLDQSGYSIGTIKLYNLTTQTTTWSASAYPTNPVHVATNLMLSPGSYQLDVLMQGIYMAGTSGRGDISFAVVPEPSVALSSFGLLTLLLQRRRTNCD